MNRKMRRAALKEQGGKPDGESAPPSEVSAHIDLGNRHFIEGRLDQAIDCYLQAIGVAPDQMDAHAP